MKTISEQLGIKEFPFEIKNKKGNRIYYEDSYGYWFRREIDSQGNGIYYEDSGGLWAKRKFDSNGNEVYYECSNGFWSKSEFDSEGIKVYYLNSNGTIRDNRTIPEFTMEELVEKIGNFKIKK